MKPVLVATSTALLAMSLLTGSSFAAVPTAFERDVEVNRMQRVSAEFEPAGSGAEAVTYDEELVPVGARVVVLSVPNPAGTLTMVRVGGVKPDREYGAHVHRFACGADPDDAGPHFQNVTDPVQPSVDPMYANPRNEIWLDFTTGDGGDGMAWSWVPWRIGDRPAGSVVLHERHTSSEPGRAGDAGDRLACVDVPLGVGSQAG